LFRDSAIYFFRRAGVMKIVKKPWGEERWLAHTDKYAGKILIVKKGHRLSNQYHRVKHETQYVDSGRLKVELEKEGVKDTKILEAGDILEIVPGTKHRIEALEDTKIFEVSTPELDDVVRLSDDYGREGTSRP
jgi:quercetin dioxygenase-like cupin family protein